MARSESPPVRKRRDSTSSSSSAGSNSNSSNSSKEAVPSKKAKMSESPPRKRAAKGSVSPPSRFRDDRRRSRSPRVDQRRGGDRDRDDKRRDDRRRDSPPRRDRRPSPPRKERSPRRDRSPRRERSPPRRDRGGGAGGDRDRRDRSRDRDRNRSPARNDRGDGFGLSRREVRREVKEEPGSPQQSQLMKARDDRRNDQGEGKKQKWGTKAMWEEEEMKRKEKEDGPPKDKEKVNMASSGLLAQDTNTFNGVVIKYNEPQDAKIPNMRWRLYQFKEGDDSLPCLYIHRQSAYLIGRDRKIADLPVDHPSCSKQHAVLQYRSVAFEKEDGSRARRIRPYLIDLASANGTFLNGKKIDASRYIELKEKDVIKFGFSSREYVILTENALQHEGKESSPDSSDVSSDEEEGDEKKKKVKEEEED